MRNEFRSGIEEGRLKPWVPYNPSELLAFLFVIGVSMVLALILVLTNGKIIAAFAFVTVVAVFFLTFYRVDLGFDLFFAMVLTFDQFSIPGSDPITLRVHYFENLKQIPYIPSNPLGVMNPLELQLALLLLAWFLAISFRRDTRIQGQLGWGAALVFFAAMGVSLTYGLKTGGAFLPSLWSVRALFYFGFLYFFVPQVIQTRKQIETIMWIAIFAITFKAIQGGVRLALLGFKFGPYTTLTNHEDPVFMNTLFIFLIALILFDVKTNQRKALLWFLLPLMIGYMAGQRRAAFAGFFGSLAALIVLLPKPRRWMLIKALVPIMILFAAYSAVFWNDPGRLGLPVQMIKSGIFQKNKADDGARYLSNLYRLNEDYDLAVTIRHKPITGIGFGHKYLQPIELPRIVFPLQDYISHNAILWIMVEMGAVGFLLFFLFMDTIVFRGAAVFRKLEDPYLKAVCLVVVIAVVNQVMVSYYDLQLTFYRNMVYLGTLTGFLPTLSRLHDEEKASSQSGRKPSQLQI